MTGRKQELNLQLYMMFDGALLVLAFWSAYSLRFYSTDLFGLERPIAQFDEFRWLLPVIVPFGPMFLELHGYYVHPLQKTFVRSIYQMLRSAVWLGLLVGICVIFFRLQVPSRAVALIFALLAMVLLILREQFTIHRYRELAKSGKNREQVLLAGTPEDMLALRKGLTPVQLIEMEIVSEIDIENQPVADFVESLHHHSINRVIFAGSHAHLNRLQEAIAACEIEGVEAWLVADFIKTSIARANFDVLGSRPMLVFRTTPEISWELLIKGVVDRLGALTLLLLAFPILLTTALAIKITSPGPVIFRQKRSGKNGRPFTMFKFRTMTVDAEARRVELAAKNEMSGPVFKVANDPRVTKIGRWLRKTSIDELPQLFNVLQGDMSLVGPRPLPLYEVAKFEHSAQRRRLSVRPGLTCLWQVSGRNKICSFETWVQLDLEYIDNWSIWLDLKILLMTIPAVFLGSGAK